MSWKKSFDIRSDEGFYASQERCIILKTEDYHEDEDCICRLRQGIELTDLDEQQGSKCIAIPKSQPGFLDVVPDAPALTNAPHAQAEVQQG